MIYYDNFITELQPNEIFVFGSNEAGRHGRGAAKQALEWGAKWGLAEGMSGQTYALPTVDSNIYRLLPMYIKPYVDRFIDFATQNTHYNFLLTEVGCGLAGYEIKDIAPMFSRVRDEEINNIILPKRFYEFLLLNL